MTENGFQNIPLLFGIITHALHFKIGSPGLNTLTTTFLPLTKDTVETIFGHILSNRLFCFDCSIHDLEALPLSVANERSYKALDWGCREGGGRTEYLYLSRIEWKCLQYVV
jgi:hypothetical protein